MPGIKWVMVTLLILCLFTWHSDQAYAAKNGFHVSAWILNTGVADEFDVVESTEDGWTPISPQASLGYQKDPHWFRFEVASNPSRVNGVDYFVVENPVLDDLTIWVQGRTASGHLSQWKSWRVGDKFPFAQRPVLNRNIVIPFGDVIRGDNYEFYKVYIRVETSSSLQVPIKLMQESEFRGSELIDHLFYGAYAGVMLGLVVYNLLLWLMVKEAIYGFYILWASSFALFIITLEGFAFQFFWPESVYWNDRALIFFLGCSLIFANAFILGYLSDWGGLPKIFRHVKAESLFAALIVVACIFFLGYRLGIQIVIGMATFLVIRVQVLLIWSVLSGYRPSRLLLLSFTFIFFAGLVLACQRTGLIDYSDWSQHATLVGSAIEVILMSTVMGDRLSKARHLGAQAEELSTLNQQLSLANVAIESARDLAEERALAVLALKEKVKQDADQRDRERLRFLAAAVHDLKQPLQAITVALAPLRHAVQTGDQPEAISLISLLRESSNGLSAQLNSLLDLSRLETGEVRADLTSCSLGEIWNNLRASVDDLSIRMNVRLIVDIPLSAWVFSDAEMLRRVFLNLVSNGIKYSDPVKLHSGCWVSIKARQNDLQWILTIEDNGIGIDERHIVSGDIFRPFFQIHRELPQDVRGVGLGLSIVNSAVKLLDGHRLSVRSSPSVGTSFEVIMPKADVPLVSVQGKRFLQDVELVNLRYAYVLIVEDDPLVREGLSRLLRSKGVNHHFCSTYAELVVFLQSYERAPDMCICDYLLDAGRTAKDVIGLLHSEFGELPIMILSAEKLVASHFDGYQNVHFLSKPASVNDLIEGLESMSPVLNNRNPKAPS